MYARPDQYTVFAVCLRTASSMNTYRFIATLHDTEAINMTPNQRMGLLGRKWREERNFWIAALTFLLWG